MDDDTVLVRVRSGSHHVGDDVYAAGDTLTVPRHVYQAFIDRFDIVGEIAPVPGEESFEGMEDAEPLPDFSHYESLSALLAAVDAGEVTAADALAWEQSKTNPRKTAVKMLKARL